MSAQHSHPFVCCVHSGWTYGDWSGLEAAGDGGLGEGEAWWSSPTAQTVQARVADYLRGEQEAMEARVRSYVEAEHRRYDLLRQEARRQRDSVLRDLVARGLIDGPNDELANLPGHALRLRNGSGSEDSAVPLSPVSLASLNDASQALGAKAIGPPRPNNQSPVVGSEDSGLGSTRRTQEEDIEEPLFSLDEETGPLPIFKVHPPPAPLPPCPADDEDSGTEEDLRNALKAPSAGPKASARPVAEAAGPLISACGKSLPVRVPCRFWPPPEAVASANASSSEDEGEGPQIAVKPTQTKAPTSGRRRDAEMAASIQKLARSIQPADDPERIFGERPQRRRFRTSAHAASNVVRQRHSGRQHLQAFPDPLHQ